MKKLGLLLCLLLCCAGSLSQRQVKPFFVQNMIGSGGGSVSWTLMFHVITNGTGSITTPAVDSTGCNLIVINGGWFSGAGTPSDSPANTYVRTAANGDTSGIYSNQVSYVINPTTSASHTFSFNGSFDVVEVTGWKKTGGTPVFDQQNGTNYPSATPNTTTIQPNAVTPTASPSIAIATFTCNDIGGNSPIPATVDSGFTISDQQKSSAGTLYSGMAYTNGVGTVSINPTFTMATTLNDINCSIKSFK